MRTSAVLPRCGAFAGTYTGLGTVEINDADQDRFILQVDNGTLVLAYALFANQ